MIVKSLIKAEPNVGLQCKVELLQSNLISSYASLPFKHPNIPGDKIIK